VNKNRQKASAIAHKIAVNNMAKLGLKPGPVVLFFLRAHVLRHYMKSKAFVVWALVGRFLYWLKSK